MAIPSAAVRIDVLWTSTNWTGVNVWHGQTSISGAPTTADTQTLVDRLQTFYTALAPQIGSSAVLTVGVRAIAIGQTPVQFIPVTPRTVGGSRAGEPLPTQTTLTLKLRTPNATKRGRGRIFLGQFLEDQSSSGVPSSTLVSAVNTAAAGLISSPFSALPALGVLSELGTGTPAAPDPYLTLINSAVSGTTWTVLRSRRR